jgi:hypothetical protein
MNDPMNKQPLPFADKPDAPKHSNESRKASIARALQAGDEARASNSYISADEFLQRLDRSLARARGKTRPD